MYRIEFGHNEGPKWIPETTLEFEQFADAKTELSKISDELKLGDTKDTQVRMFGPNDQLYHYITSQHPNISLPSNGSL